MKDAVSTNFSGDDRLGFIPQKVGLRSVIEHTQLLPGRIHNRRMQDLRETTLIFDDLVVTGDVGDHERQVQGLRIVLDRFPNYGT